VVTSWYTIWAKVIVIVATYCSVVTVGGEVDMSYLGRSGSAEGEGHTVLAGGGGGSGGALSFPCSWRAGLLLLEGVGRDPLGECVACCRTSGVGCKRRPERLTEVGSQCPGGMPREGRGLGVVG